MTGLIIAAVVGIIIIASSIPLLKGRGAFLMAGYNTMSDQEKAAWNEKLLCRSLGKLLLIAGVWVMAIGVLSYFDLIWIINVSVPLSIVVLIIWIVYINKSPKFRQ